MRVFALSDIHVDYDVNARWTQNLSQADYQEDVLILAGDVTHKLSLLAWCLSTLAVRFKQVLFVPGNHDLWVAGDAQEKTSLQKFHDVAIAARENGASMRPFSKDRVLIAPLLGWYDYTFGEPSRELRRMWMDYRACRWPEGFGPAQTTAHFTAMNDLQVPPDTTKVITFSHFLPRRDLVSTLGPRKHSFLDPVLGSTLLERQLRQLHSSIHVYGHSHINRKIRLEGTQYINNAFGYPGEDAITAKQLVCIDEI